jgi:hypothetical protein
METIKRYWIYVVFLILAVVLPTVWLPKGYIYISEEDNFANFQNVVYRNLYSWSPPVNNGQPVTPADQSTIVPNGIFYFALSQLNLPNYLIQRLFLSFYIFFTLVSITYFLRLFTSSNILLFIGGFFYYFNFYTFSTIFYSAKMPQLVLLPLFFTFMYRYLNSKKYKYAIFNFISLFIFQSVFANLAVAAASFLIYLLSIFYFMLEKHIDIAHFIRDYLKKCIEFFILLLPLVLYNYIILYFSLIFNGDYITLKGVHQSVQSALYLVLQFRGSWWEFLSTGAVSYNPWLWFYSHPVIVFITFSLLLISCLLYVQKNLKNTHIFFLLAYIISVFLACGLSFSPGLYYWLMDNIPLFYIFREPWARFTPISLFFITTILIMSLEHIKKYKRGLIILTFFLVIIRGLPFFSPHFINNVSSRWDIPFMKLPNYWQEYNKWSKNYQEKKVLSIPLSYFNRDWYKENLGNVRHPLLRLFGLTQVIYDFPNSSFGKIIERSIAKKNFNFFKIATIDYVLVQRDIDIKSNLYTSTARKIDSQLVDYLTNNLFTQFGNKLFLYNVKKEFYLPQIYAANTSKELNVESNSKDALDKLITYISTSEYKMRSAVFFKNNKLGNRSTPLFQINSTPNLNFKKVNPTKYQVDIQNAKGSFIVVFNETFNPFWKLYLSGLTESSMSETWFSKFNNNIISVPDNKHMLVNGYANAWMVNTEQVCSYATICTKNRDGSYSMKFIIEYWPQRIFFGALLLTFLPLIFSFIYFVNKFHRMLLYNRFNKKITTHV